jgi:hypothetical protein
MSQLSPELVKELIPKVGPRITFMAKWKRHFSPEEVWSDTSSPSCSSTKSSTESVCNYSIVNNTKSVRITSCIFTTIIHYTFLTAWEQCHINWLSARCNKFYNWITIGWWIPWLSYDQARLFYWEKRIWKKHRLFSVREILQKTVQGEAILKSYKKTKELTRTTRNIIVDCIMSEVVNSKHQ